MNEKYVVREAKDEDVLQIHEIFNERILNSTCIFAYDTVSIENRFTWFHDLKSKGYPVIVAAEKESDKAIAYACLGQFRPHPAYVLTAEISLYIHQEHQRRGLGALLLQEMLRIGREMNFRSIIAGITAENEGSIVLFSKFKFQNMGRAHDVGYKFGRFLDVVFMEYATDAQVTLKEGKHPSFKQFPRDQYVYGQSLF